jgi:hypothetical protein
MKERLLDIVVVICEVYGKKKKDEERGEYVVGMIK